MQPSFSLRSFVLALFVLSAFALGACGQRGPLYLPEEQKAGRNDLKVDTRTPRSTDNATKRRSTNQQ